MIERQVTQELLDLFNIDEQTLNTQGLQITTTIDPKAQQAAEAAASEYLGRPGPRHAHRDRVDRPENGRGEGVLRRHATPTGFDFAQAGLPTGSSFKVFALVAALQQGMGLGYQVDSSPVTVNGIKITNVEGEGCGTCNIAEALKRSLNTSYYRLMLKLKNGPADVADAAHKAGIAESFPGVDHTLSEDGKGGPPNNGIVLGQYQTRVLDMASAYATLAASGVYHKPHFVQKVVNSRGEVLFDAGQQDNSGEQRIDKAVADNVTSAMQPIAGCSNGHNLAGGRPSAAKTGTNQLGDTDANRDAWMVGYTPSLSTAVWVGTTEGTKPLENTSGSPVYGSGLPSDIWKSTMDGALKGTENESFPKPDRDRRLCGRAAGTAPAAVPLRRPRRRRRSFSRRSKWRRALRSRSARRPPCPRSSGAGRTRARAAGSAAAWTSSAPVTEREPATVSPAVLVEPHRRLGRLELFAGSAGRRPAEPRRPRPAQPHRHDRRGAVRGDRRAGRPARADRAPTLPDAAAGDADHRAWCSSRWATRRRRRACRPPAPAPPISGWATGRTRGPTTSSATPTPFRCTPRSC